MVSREVDVWLLLPVPAVAVAVAVTATLALLVGAGKPLQPASNRQNAPSAQTTRVRRRRYSTPPRLRAAPRAATTSRQDWEPAVATALRRQRRR